MKRAFGVKTVNGNECMYYSVLYNGIDWRVSVRSPEKKHLLYDMCVALLSNDDIVDIKSAEISELLSGQKITDLEVSPIAKSVCNALASWHIVVGAAYNAEGLFTYTAYYDQGKKLLNGCAPSLSSNVILEKVILNYATTDKTFLVIFGELGRALTGLSIEDSKEIPLERVINGIPQNSLSYKIAQGMDRE